MKQLIPSLVSALAFLAISGCFPKAESPLKSLNSNELKSLATKPDTLTVVNLWATWCEPCRREIPEFVKFQKSATGNKIQLVLLSADKAEDISKADEFLKSAGVDFATYHLADPIDVFAKAWLPQWSAILPTTFILDGNGLLKTFWVGETTQNLLETKLKGLGTAGIAPEKPPVLQRHAK